MDEATSLFPFTLSRGAMRCAASRKVSKAIPWGTFRLAPDSRPGRLKGEERKAP